MAPPKTWGLVLWPLNDFVRLAFWISRVKFDGEHDTDDKAQLYAYYLKKLLKPAIGPDQIATYERKIEIATNKTVISKFHETLEKGLLPYHLAQADNTALLLEHHWGFLRGNFSKAANDVWKSRDIWRGDDLTKIFTDNKGLFRSKAPPTFMAITDQECPRLEPSTLNPRFDREIGFSNPKTTLFEVCKNLEESNIINITNVPAADKVRNQQDLVDLMNKYY
ncbi:hypothetical protein MMC15_001574 [Xylographa vitiligo]|nr:hypothetical protein [Xylographa vitiligo]